MNREEFRKDAAGLLEQLYRMTRLAPVGADVHDAARNTALRLKSYIEQNEKETTDTTADTLADLMRGNGADEVGDGVVDRLAGGVSADVRTE